MKALILKLVFMILIICLMVTFCDHLKLHNLRGVWDLEYVTWEKSDTTITHQYDEILTFSKGYYTNIQTSPTDETFVNAHAGTYTLSGDTCFIKVIYASHPQMKGMELIELYNINGDTLTTIIPSVEEGMSQSKWVYTRLK